MAKPFLKWAGGKTRLLPELLSRLPADVEQRRHVEPFLGGGALFFAREPKRALLADMNADLVTTYLVVRDWPEVLIRLLEYRAAEHARDPKGSYYAVRDAYNVVGAEWTAYWHTHRVERAEHFIYLNKTCFNGLHRVNGRGEFNVPFGKHDTFEVDAEGIREASIALQRAEIVCADFEALVGWHVDPGDFVYLDPPYDPLSETANFTAYAGGFGYSDQERVERVISYLMLKRVPALVSNHDTPRVRMLYADLHIEEINAPRSIGATTRGTAREILARTYEVAA